MAEHEQILEEIFKDKKIENYELLSGLRHVNIKVELADEEPVIVRFMGKEKEHQFFKGTGYFQTGLTIDQEAEILNILKPVLEERIPNIIEKGSIEDGNYLLVSCLKGQPLRDVRAETSIENGEKTLYSLGSLVGELHKNLEFKEFGTFSGKNYETWIEFWTYFATSKTNNPNFEKLFTKSERKEVLDYIEKQTKIKIPVKSTLVLYDLHDANFMINENYEVSGVFDFDHTHKGAGQVEIFPIEETFFTAPFKGETDKEKLEKAFNNGYKNSLGLEFEQDPKIRELGWFNHSLYSAISKYAVREKRPGFTEVCKHRVLSVIRNGEVDTTKFFDIKNNISRILPPYEDVVKKYEGSIEK